MEIKVGDLVSIRHFSGTKLFKSLVLESNNDEVLLKLTEDIALLNCSIGDPIVLGCELEENVYISSCTTLNVDKQQNTLKLKIDNYETTSNKRLFREISRVTVCRSSNRRVQQKISGNCQKYQF